MRRWLWLSLLAALPLQAETLRLEGELFARDSAPLMPPSIDAIWQFSIARLTPDGTPVRAGQPVLAFEGGEVQKRLMEKMSALAEKQSQHDKLRLELAERERSERLATAERRANRDKAQRKASQPEHLLGRVDYRKLVAERRHAERAFELAERRERLAAEQRRQERLLIEAELGQLRAEVATLQTAIASLEVTAPRDGVMRHLSDWQNNKYDVGSQVWRGVSVAEVPDPTSLAVNAVLPEHQFTRLAEGVAARVVVEGSGQLLAGRIAQIGRVVRSKSRLQPVPVLDVLVTLDAPAEQLRPGQAVRVEVDAGEHGGTTTVAP